MNRAELIKKYGNVKLKFDSYYKYTFTYTGLTDEGLTINVELGGDPDEIYKADLVLEETLTSLSKEADVLSIDVYEGNPLLKALLSTP